jgi:glycine hydroxymethyltransferase
MQAQRAGAAGVLTELTRTGLDRLARQDPTLFDLMAREYGRQQSTLSMVASSSMADASVLACEAGVLGNVTTEGYPGQRYHGGCEFVDGIEALAVERAKHAFGARYANVQPHSGSSANQIILFSTLKAGERILGLDLDAGGHLTHGARASISGQYFESLAYGLDAAGLIDYTQVREIARRERPRLIVCGASAYPRAIDFARFREIADEVDAILLADISHIAGLVAAGCHASPIDHAHFTTTSTYKQLFGPRGGLILSGRDHDRPLPGHTRRLGDAMQRAVFPVMQGTPILGAIAAKAAALARVATPQFKTLARSIVDLGQALAQSCTQHGWRVLTGGTDNHMVLIDVAERGLTGVIAERALEQCGIIINKNRIPGDRHSPLVTSGIRLGSNGMAARGMSEAAARRCVELMNTVLTQIQVCGDSEYRLPAGVAASVRDEVGALCSAFPLPGYPAMANEPQPALLEAAPA